MMKTKLLIAFILFQFVGVRASEDICLNAVKATYAGKIYNPFCARIYEEFFRGDYQLKIDIYDFSKKPKDGKYRDWEFFQDVYMGRDKYNFQDSIGVYMIFGSCSDPADGVNVIKDGSLVWYYYRDNGGSQMRSITMLMDFFKKYRRKYSKEQMLYIIAGFTINNDGRNLFSSEKRSKKIEELLSDSFLSKYAPQRAIDLLDGNKEVCVADMANKSLAIIRYNTTHLIFIDNYTGTFYLSKNNPRYQFTYLQRACLYYIRKRITAEQFLNVLNTLVDDNQNLYNGEDVGRWWRD